MIPVISFPVLDKPFLWEESVIKGIPNQKVEVSIFHIF
jgi:hypothetical protein